MKSLLENVNRIITDETISEEQRERIASPTHRYQRDGFYYTIKEFTTEFPDGIYYAGLGSQEQSEDTLFLARYFHPENRYEVTEIREITK